MGDCGWKEVRAGSGVASARRPGGNTMRARTAACALWGVLVAVSLPLAAQSPILIQNATVLTVTKGTLHIGSVLIRDGKIAEVGEKVMAPPGTKVVDANGLF